MKKKIKEDKRRKQGKSRHIILFYLFSILLLSILLVCGFFRFRFYVVLSGSMEPKLPVGSLVVADTERTNVKIGEIVTFQKSGRTVTHRVTGLKEHGYQTKGDALSGIRGTLDAEIPNPYYQWRNHRSDPSFPVFVRTEREKKVRLNYEGRK